MLYVNVHVDLPGEPILRTKTLREWLAGLVGRDIDVADETLTTVTGLSLFHSVTEALALLDITDVLSVIVDGKTAYVDTDEHSGDLATAVAELDARAVLEDEFSSMRMALSHRHGDLRLLIEVHLRRRVPADAPELTVRIAGRMDSMQIRPGETPPVYAARLRELAADTSTLDSARYRFAYLARQLEGALVGELGELVVSSNVTRAELRLIRPGPRQLDHFRRLSWGPTVRLPKYRPVPIASRRGAYDEPFYHYYFDPYFDFAAWVTISEIVAGRGWKDVEFVIVDPEGRHLFGARDAAGKRAIGGEYDGLSKEAELVRISNTTVVVNPIVPRLEGSDPGELGDPRATSGYAGDGHSAGWSEVEGGIEGGDLGGSCGSSCGGCGSG